jgi:UDP-N-acetylglucosamine--N-acetylmuramyl-(pentapeptide) pyrophosphoryl-undecaprenol N-acetylglucosamine transferase
MTKIMIMAGGTGGHVFPALAVAEELKQRGVDIAWMGTAQGIEADLVPKAGYPLFEIKVRGLRGNGVFGWLLAPFKVCKAIWEAVRIMRVWQPDVVMGLGGFASGPGGVAAKLLAKPLVIHEQNAIPGLTNRLLAKIAQVVFEGFPNSFHQAVNAVWVGNPVRKQIEDIQPPEQRFAEPKQTFNLLVLGGSLGAKTLNETVPQALAMIDDELRPTVLHQCGKRHIDACRQHYQQAGVQADVTAFIDDMAKVYAEADLVICRAGALTVAELAAAGVGSILVPYPFAVDDHQTHNASLLVEAGAAQLIKDNELNATDMAKKIRWFTTQREDVLKMAQAARQVAKIGTVNVIADTCMELAHG